MGSAVAVIEHSKQSTVHTVTEIRDFFRTKVSETRALFASAGVALVSGTAGKPALVDPATLTADPTVPPFNSNSTQVLFLCTDYYALSTGTGSTLYVSVEFNAKRIAQSTNTAAGTYFAYIVFRAGWSVTASGFPEGQPVIFGWSGNTSLAATTNTFAGFQSPPSAVYLSHQPGFLAMGYGAASSANTANFTESFFCIERHHDASGVLVGGGDAAFTSFARSTGGGLASVGATSIRTVLMRSQDNVSVIDTTPVSGPGPVAGPWFPAGPGGTAVYGPSATIAVYPRLYFGTFPTYSRYTQGIAVANAPGPSSSLTLPNAVGGGTSPYRALPFSSGSGNHALLVRY